MDVGSVMTLKIRCPHCQKLYAADSERIGRRIRCKKCGESFVIEAPRDTPGPTLAGELLPQSEATSAETTEPDVQAELAHLSTRPRDREPKTTALRATLEMYVRRTLILVAICFSVGVTIQRNKTGLPLIALVRFGVVFLLFLLIVVPLSYQSVAASFRRFRKKPPTAAGARVAATFAIPASLGFIAWQFFKTPAALVGGLLIALPLSLGIYWFQFRMGIVEAIASFLRAAISFLIGTAVSIAIVIAINYVVNRALIDAHAVAYHESPLGEVLAWKPPQPPALVAARVENVRHSSQGTLPSNLSQSTPVDPPPLLFDLRDATPNAQAASGATSRTGQPLFVNPEDDQFLADLGKNTQPWIKQVSRPDGQSPFDFLVVPSEVSQYVGFVSLDAKTPMTRRIGVGLALDSRIRRAASFDIRHDANPHAFPHDYQLNAEGTILFHLSGLTVEMISTATHRKDAFPLTVPTRAPIDRLLPQLAGLTREHGVVVRWSTLGVTEQVVQRYAYSTRQLESTSEIHDASLATEASAVGTSSTGATWLASIVTPARQPLSISLLDVNASGSSLTCTALPAPAPDLSEYEHVELSFSPDARQLALMLTDRSQAIVYVWTSNDLSTAPLKVVPPMLAPALASAHVAGPRIRWIDDQMLLVDGQAVISTNPDHPGILGMLSDNAAMGAVSIAPDDVLLSYLGTDGSCHLAEVLFDAKALHDALPVK